MTEVALTIPEAMHCEDVGYRRHCLNAYSKRANSHGLGDRWKGRDEDALGAFGEYAVSLVLNLAWRPVVADPWALAGDVGRLQVRTRGPKGQCLLLHRSDDPDGIFVSVAQVDALTYNVCGWLRGRDGMAEEFWGNPFNTGRPAYWVPSGRLRPMDELRTLLHGQPVGYHQPTLSEAG